MRAIIKRELKNYLKNPIFWVGMVIVIIGVYQSVSPYLNIHYFSSDKEIQELGDVKAIGDEDIMDGYIPAAPEQQRVMWEEQIYRSLVEEYEMSKENAEGVIEEMKALTIEDAFRYLEETYNYYGANYVYEDLTFYQGSMQEVNQYIKSKLDTHTFSYYFARKFADFGGLYMGFFATILLAFLFLQDSRRNTYELLHTKPIRAWQYVMGKIGSGLLAVLLVLAVLSMVFIGLCGISGKSSGFAVNPIDFLIAEGVYILPNMLMIVCVYAIVALLFKNPLPAVPLLLLYMVYSNMGSTGTDGIYGYYGRPLAIMVRFPGEFFDTTPPPMVMLNQTFLILASVCLMIFTIFIWRRRRIY